MNKTSQNHKQRRMAQLILAIVVIVAGILFTTIMVMWRISAYEAFDADTSTHISTHSSIPKELSDALSKPQTPTLELDDFSVIVIPDTQKYAKYYPDTFCKQTEWIVAQKEARNILFASHMGDIVDSYKKSPEEWKVADKCMSILEPEIPYSILPGNHDTDEKMRERGMSAYKTYFSSKRFNSYPWYGGSFDDNTNSYQIIKTPIGNILFLSLEIEPRNEALVWAQGVLDAHKNIYTVISTHKYLPDEGASRDTDRLYSEKGNTGEDIWQKLIRKNCQIDLVLNGHYHSEDGENMLGSKNDCNEDVHQIVQDYQGRELGGNGLLRIYTFKPSSKLIHIETYSPVTKLYEADKDSDFTIPLKVR